MNVILVSIPAVGLLALICAYIKGSWLDRQEMGTERMKEFSGYIAEGIMAFLAREYKVLAIFTLVVSLILVFSNGLLADTSWLISISFLAGGLLSALSGYFGMKIAAKANVRTANACRQSLNKGLAVAFSGGSVLGLSVVGLGLLGLSVLFLVFKYFWKPGSMADINEMMIAINVLTWFCLGASFIALFARVGGGIYIKAADIAADPVGKIEEGTPVNDPRNPATIADSVGDNVGDVAGLGADLFESYVGAIVGSMVLGASMYAGLKAGGFDGMVAVYTPLILAAAGIICSIIGIFLVRTGEGGNPQTGLNIGTFGAVGLMMIASLVTIMKLFPEQWTDGDLTYHWWGIWLAVIVGLTAPTFIGLAMKYFYAQGKSPTMAIVEASETGSATNIIAGLSVAMNSTSIPIILIAATIIVSYYYAGLYGIAMSALGMLSTTGIKLAVDAFGPISGNADTIAEMCELDQEIRKRTSKLDNVGKTTAVNGKGFAIGSATLTALALFSAYLTQMHGKVVIDATNPYIISGMLIGAMMPFVFSARVMSGGCEAAHDLIEEVRREFREIPGLLKGKAKADYPKCVDISTTVAMKKMVVPVIMAVAVPLVVGLISPNALGGLLVGVTISGVCMAIFQSNNTFKDTSGPSLNILIKSMSVVAMVIAPILYRIHFA